MSRGFLNYTTVVVKVLSIGIRLTKTTSKFYIASISNRNPPDGLVGAKIACLGIHMTTPSGAGLGVEMFLHFCNKFSKAFVNSLNDNILLHLGTLRFNIL